MALDARQVIDQIMSDPRFAARMRPADGHRSARVYDDEPILKTGRQMLDERVRAEQALPEAYRVARSVVRSGSDMATRARVFREQGLLLADACDDAPYFGEFDRYYPTYQDMSDRQLRGYVTWRGHVRAGDVERAPLAFMFVYAYELLNGIGVAGPEEGFQTLRGFWERYRDLEPALDRYLRGWLTEYVAYHGLPAGLVEGDPLLAAPLERDRALLTVLEPQGRTREEVFDALAELSTYRVERSRLYRERPDDVRRVCFGVLARLEPYYAKHRSAGLRQSLFGQPVSLPHRMFASAVFCETSRHPDAVYEFNAIRRYTCANGAWTYDCYPGDRSSGLGDILQAVDARMRQRLDHPHQLKEAKTPKYLLRFIDQEVDELLAWQAAHAPVRVEIDRSKLGGIRASAALTCEALLVDEERAEVEEPAVAETSAVAETPAAGLAEKPAAPGANCPPEAPAPAAPEAAAAPAVFSAPVPGSAAATTCGLAPAEAALLACLLDGGDPRPVARGAGASLDMLVDAVNERLFDLVGDTVVEFDGDAPALVPDYVEDVRAALGR